MAGPGGGRGGSGGLVRALLRLAVMITLGFGVGLVFGLVTEEPELLGRHLRGESEAVGLAGGEALGGALDGTHAQPLEQASALAASPTRTGSSLGSAAPSGSAGSDPTYVSAATQARPIEDPAIAAKNLPSVAAPRDPVPSAALRDDWASAGQRVAARPPRALEAEASTALAAPVPAAPATAPPLAAALPTEASAIRREPRPSAPVWAIQVGAFSEASAADRLAEGLAAEYPVKILPAGRAGGNFRVRVQPMPDEAIARETAERLKRDHGLPTWVTPVSSGE